MIDLHRLRADPSNVRELLKKKDPQFPIDRLISLDEQVRTLKMRVDELRNKKNELAKMGKGGVTDEIRHLSKSVSDELKSVETQLETIQNEFTDLYLICPNIPLESVPAGNKDNNVVVKEYGKQPTFTFTPKNHVELGDLNGWFDFEAAATMTASNFALYKGEAVLIIYRLMLYMLKHAIKHGFTPVLPPYMVNESALTGAGNFPRFKDDVYKIQEHNLYLTPTAEVNLTSMYKNRILLQEELPISMTAWTSCFRREAGGYGAQERGLIRIHQFEKVELYTLCVPEQSEHEQQRMLTCAEELLQALGLHYRISLLAAQDCSFSSAKTYDIEVWMPGQGVYKEVSSISNCTDFQARRSEIRYKKTAADKAHLVYTLNGSSLALPRVLVALMETYQQVDGSIVLPKVLDSLTI